MLDSHVTITEAMRISGYTRFHIYNLIAEGSLTTRRSWTDRPRILVSRYSLEKYIKTQARKQAKHKRAHKKYFAERRDKLNNQSELVTIKVGDSADAQS